jgi:hypothetical protein
MWVDDFLDCETRGSRRAWKIENSNVKNPALEKRQAMGIVKYCVKRMGTSSKILNVASMLLGGAGAFVFLRALFHHQYVLYSYRWQRWTPTLVPALMGAWLFVFGLVGLIRRKQGKPPGGSGVPRK